MYWRVDADNTTYFLKKAPIEKVLRNVCREHERDFGTIPNELVLYYPDGNIKTFHPVIVS